jgi:hypothetical protein
VPGKGAPPIGQDRQKRLLLECREFGRRLGLPIALLHFPVLAPSWLQFWECSGPCGRANICCFGIGQNRRVRLSLLFIGSLPKIL